MVSDFSPVQKEIISGLTAGTITTVSTHPLDLVKVRLQLLATNKKPQGYYDVVKRIVKDSKQHSFFRETYRGLGVNLLGNSIAWGLYFGLYRASKDWVFQWCNTDVKRSNDTMNNDKEMTPLMYLLAAAMSGVATSVLTNPIWVIKTRIMSTSFVDSRSYRSTVDGIKKLYRIEGLAGFWRGLVPSLFGVSQGAIYFTVYDTLKYHYFAAKHVDKKKKLSNLEYITITSLSKMVSVTAVYPLQLLKSNLQSFEVSTVINPKTSHRVWKLITTIYVRDGVTGLYKGLLANLIRAVPSTCITFCVYENFRHWL